MLGKITGLRLDLHPADVAGRVGIAQWLRLAFARTSARVGEGLS
jgi:hypothetical protein